MNNNIHKTYEIAKKALRSNYREHGIYAGQRHFDDYWARDSFFSSLGALKLGDYEIVKKNLLLFIKYQRENGQLPFRIGDYNIISKFYQIKFKKELKPRFKEDKNVSFPLDSNSLFVVSAYAYIKKTKDIKFAKKYFKHFESAIEWSFRHDTDKNLLLEDRPYSTWEDSLRISGESIYTNVCHYNGVRSLSKIAKLIKSNKYNKYQNIANKIRDRINGLLWNGEYYSNYYFAGKRYDYFSTAGNLLAIIWHLADKEKAIKIEKCIEKFGINKCVPSLTNYPRYSFKHVFPWFYLIKMHDYHNQGMCWLWLGCEDVVAKSMLGMKKEAMDLLRRISDIIVKYNNVYEVYEQNGKPVNRLFYKSEVPFSWGSAMFIMAYKSVFK